MFLCTLWPTFCTLYIMPVFRPTQWMIDNHKEKGEKEWEIYAECVRDAMCKAGGFPRFKDQPLKDKRAYEYFMNYKSDTLEFTTDEGKVLNWTADFFNDEKKSERSKLVAGNQANSS